MHHRVTMKEALDTAKAAKDWAGAGLGESSSSSTSGHVRAAPEPRRLP